MTTAARWVGLTLIAGLLALMLGPFQGLEQATGQDDKLLHTLAFAAISVALFLNLPLLGRVQVSGLACLLGVAVEVAQGITGRDMDPEDVAADLVGISIVALLWFRRKLI